MYSKKNVLAFYKDSHFFKKISSPTWSNLVLVTDIDRTFYDIKKPSNSVDLYKKLVELNIPLCYCTGQGIDSVVAKMDGLLPDICISAAGTEIWVRKKNGYVVDGFFSKLISKSWDRSKIYNQAKNWVKLDKRLNFQPRDQENSKSSPQPFKISLTFHGNFSDLAPLRRELDEKFNNQTGLVVSTNWKDSNSLCLDFLPMHNNLTGKAMSVDYLQEKFNFQTITAGDDTNDIDLLFKTNSSAVIVGNASAGLLNFMREELKLKLNAGETVRLGNKEVHYGSLNGPRSILTALLKKDFKKDI